MEVWTVMGDHVRLDSPNRARFRLIVMFLVATATSAPVRGQAPAAPDCATCDNTRVVRCKYHGELWDEMQTAEFFSEWGEREFSCCSLLGATDCADCVDANTPGPVGTIKARHRRWVETAWRGSLTAQQSTPTLERIIDRITAETTVVSSKHFFLVTDHPSERLKSGQLAVVLPELKELEARFPTAVNADANVEQHEWAYLYLQRCEDQRRRFLDFLGLEDDSAYGYVSPGIEVFALTSLDSFRVFELLHDGASRCFGGPERFALLVTDQGRINHLFKKNPYGEDDWMRAVLISRATAAMLSQYMWADGKFRQTLWLPRFLAMGIPHYFEMQVVGVGAFYSESSELDGGLASWESSEWHKLMYRAVRQKSAPSVGHLTRLDPSGSNSMSEDHIAAWGFIAYVHALHGPEKFRHYLDAMREGSTPTHALEEVFRQTEGQLTITWHDWVREARGKEQAPDPNLEHTIDNPESVAAIFDRIWEDRHLYPQNDWLSAIDALRYAGWEDAAERLLLVIHEGEDVGAELAVETLRGIGDDRMVPMLSKAMKDASRGKTDDEWRRLIRIAGSLPGSSATLVPELMRFRDLRQCGPRIRAEVDRSLGELGDEAAMPALIEDTGYYHHLVRAEAATALAAIADDGGKRHAVQLLGDESWHVRMASIDVFERLDEWETIPILIRRLEKENGRLREDIIEVLQKIAGPSSKAPSSHEAKHWLQWWSAHGSNLDGRNPDDASEAAYRTVSATAGSLGRIYSKKFLFLVDISSSMMQGIWTVDEDGKPLALKPKIAYVVEELERVIEGLEEEVEFNVLMFASEVQPWRESIAQATSKNKKSATRWLKYLELGTNQTTDLHSALETVLEQADAGLEGGTTESVIDTMYLISDGMPTAGVTDAQALLSWLTERNRAHKIRLNVITLGATDTDLGLLNKFAEANGGKCLVITN